MSLVNIKIFRFGKKMKIEAPQLWVVKINSSTSRYYIKSQHTYLKVIIMITRFTKI